MAAFGLTAADVGILVDHDAVEGCAEEFALGEEVVIAAIAGRRVDGGSTLVGQFANRPADLLK